MDFVTLEFNDQSGLLEAYGCNRLEGPKKTWTYSDFEVYNKAAITPSMYEWMATRVYFTLNNLRITEEYLKNQWCDEWNLEAFNSYWALPKGEREELHKQITDNLKAQLVLAMEKEEAARKALDASPFDPMSPIYVECCNFLRGLITQNMYKAKRLEEMLDEEEKYIV
jgi:hypothetical protein